MLNQNEQSLTPFDNRVEPIINNNNPPLTISQSASHLNATKKLWSRIISISIVAVLAAAIITVILLFKLKKNSEEISSVANATPMLINTSTVTTAVLTTLPMTTSTLVASTSLTTILTGLQTTTNLIMTSTGFQTTSTNLTTILTSRQPTSTNQLTVVSSLQTSFTNPTTATSTFQAPSTNSTTVAIAITTANNRTTASTLTTIITSLSTTTRAPTCNVTTCRGVISYYLSRGWGYDTINFGECVSCTRATYPNYPSDWSNRWYTLDLYIPSSAGQDCSGNPATGTLTTCQLYCLYDTTCVGFSRQKNVSDSDGTGQCWLKNNIQSNQILSDLTWHTVAFNSTS